MRPEYDEVWPWMAATSHNGAGHLCYGEMNAL